MSQVVLALDVVTGLVGLGASANAPTVSTQATTAAINQTESYQPMLYNFVNATCYGSGTFKCVALQLYLDYYSSVIVCEICSSDRSQSGLQGIEAAETMVCRSQQ